MINTNLCRAAEEAEKIAAAARKKAEIAELLKKEEEEIAAGRKLRGGDKVAARQSRELMKEGSAYDGSQAVALEARGIDAALAALTIATGGEGGGDGDDVERAQNILRESITGIKVRCIACPYAQAGTTTNTATQHSRLCHFCP
jgi:hypothetical protein